MWNVSHATGEILPEDITVLFVDDEPSILRSLERILLHKPFISIFASSGNEALDIIGSRPVHAVVTDIMMPGMDGLTLLNKIRGSNPDVVRVVLTAYAQAGVLLEAINSGDIFRFMLKPASPENLDEVCHQLIAEVIRRDKERQVDRMKTELIASVSHELRTPLAAIKGFTATILADREMDLGTRHEFLSMMDHECDRLSTMIESLLDLERIESGCEDLSLTPVHVDELLHEVFDGLSIVAERSVVSLERDISAVHEGVVHADREKAFRLFYNLLSNAIKFSRANGTVTIEATQDGATATIRIIDRGEGIPKSELHLAGTRFFRGKRAAGKPGSGLGLSLAYRIAALHGWGLAIESCVGEGTVVTVTINHMVGNTEEI